MAMSNQGFFGSIFESPDEDPLLQSDDCTSESSASESGASDPSVQHESRSSDRRNEDQRDEGWRSDDQSDDSRSDDSRSDDSRSDDSRSDEDWNEDWNDDWMDDDAFSGDGASYGSDATFYDDLYGDATPSNDADGDLEETDVQDVYVALDDAESSLQTLNAAVDDGWRMTHVDLVGSGAFASDPQVVITIERSHPRSLFDFGPGG